MPNQTLEDAGIVLSMGFSRFLIVLLVACSSCEDDEAVVTPDPAVAISALLDVDGALAAGAGATTDFDIQVNAGDHVTVSVTSTAFDPVIAVQPPGGSVMSNDDWHGSREESRLSTTAITAGALKVTVTSFDPQASGAFHVTVQREGGGTVATPNTATVTLAPGQTIDGQLGASDHALADGRFSDHYVVNGVAGTSLELRIDATGDEVPNAHLMSPTGHSLAPAANGRYAIVEPGPHRLQLISAQPAQNAGYRIALTQSQTQVIPTLARSHHQLPTSAEGPALQIGQSIRGQLSAATTLPSGEPAMVYQLSGTQGQPLHLEMSSPVVDSYLMVLSPSGQHWENDDHSGTTDARLDITLPESGVYRIIATAYRADMIGAFELKSSAERASETNTAAAAAGTTPAGSETRPGSLIQGDATIQSGEFADSFEVQLAANERVRFDARSSAFDTYLIVRPPSGDATDNDDANSPDTDAGLDYVAAVGGTYNITVTSYQPGETGAYELVITRGAGGGAAAPANTAGGNAETTPATGDVVQGALAAGDSTLQSGEFRDAYTRSFTPGAPIQIRLDSTQFDPYLIVTSPSGDQSDNDDYQGSRNAGVDIPRAEAGDYRIVATSYEPGESGSYALRFGAGAAIPQANGGTNAGGGNQAANGAARVFGLFAGITNYPAGVGNLPECANDAIKLAEALRNHGLLDPSRQVLLTDSEATRANVLNAIQRFGAEMGPNDVFVFFYSGHGNQRSGSTDPREIDGTDESLVLYDGELLDNEMAQAFEVINNGTSVIALDSCYSGGFAKDLITRPGRVGLFSSEEDVLSAVAGQFQAGGYLSHFLRTAVSGEADRSPQDRVLTVGELTHFLYTQFGRHATDVQLQGAYQHLVVDRGAVQVDQVLWSY
ncbi:MAG: hypothetical protein ACI9KE_001130 [Polyangiales bacterium]|jgi:hypothetical protein